MVDPTGWIKKELLRLYPEADPRLQSAGTSPGIDLDGDGWINPAEEIGDLDGDGLVAGEADWELYFYRHADFLELLGESFAQAGYFAADNAVHNWLTAYRNTTVENYIEPIYEKLEKTAETTETAYRALHNDGALYPSFMEEVLDEAVGNVWTEEEFAPVSEMATRVLRTHFGISVMPPKEYIKFIRATFFELGKEALLGGEFSRAMNYYEEADNLYQTTGSLSCRAYLYARMGNLDRAEQLLKEAKKRKGAISKVRFVRAVAYFLYKKKDYAQSLRHYGMLVTPFLDPDQLYQFLIERGIVRFEMGDPIGARKDFEAVQTERTRWASNVLGGWIDQSFFAAEKYYYLGLIDFKKGALQSADLNFAKAVALNGNDPRYQQAKGVCAFEMRAYREALQHFQRAIELGTERSETFSSAGLARIKLKDWEGALADFNRCLEKEADNPYCLAGKGMALSKLSQEEAALENWKTSIGRVKNPEYRQMFLVSRGLVHAERKNWETAARDFEAAARLDGKEKGDAYYRLGLCRIETGLYDKAMEALDRAIALNPSDTKARKARLAALRKKLGLPEE